MFSLFVDQLEETGSDISQEEWIREFANKLQTYNDGNNENKWYWDYGMYSAGSDTSLGLTKGNRPLLADIDIFLYEGFSLQSLRGHPYPFSLNAYN